MRRTLPSREEMLMKPIQRRDTTVLTFGGTLTAALALALAVITCAAGCQPGTAASSASENSPENSAVPASKPVGPSTLSAAASSPSQEIWEVVRLANARIGYQHTSARRCVRDGQPVVCVEGETHMVLRRDGTPTTLEVRFHEVETPGGAVLEYENSNPFMQVRGRVAGNVVEVTTSTTGKKIVATLPWAPTYRGFLGLQQSIREKPMKPGERRAIAALETGIGQVITAELVAREMEDTPLYSGKSRLLRIDVTHKLGNDTVSETLWTDAAGEIQKTRMELLNSMAETFRVSKEAALAEAPVGDLDLIRTISVPVSRALLNPHATRRIRYRVHLEGSDPAAVFPSGRSQRVQSVDASSAEITVYAIRPGDDSGNPRAKDDPPTKDHLEPNNLVQSDNPAIVAAAEQAVAGQKDSWEAVKAMERFVDRTITEKGYSQAFDSAADVIKSHRGDCTEHAVLLAALARARGIPSRAAIGLVYQNQAFLYHMWTEVYLGARWIPVDGTLARGGIGAAHLKLADSSLVGASAYSALLPVTKVVGKLRIEVLEVE